MSYSIICVILGGVIFMQSIVHFIERKDLYNRIMSRDLREFSKLSRGSEDLSRQRESAHRKAINDWKSGGGEG